MSPFGDPQKQAERERHREKQAAEKKEAQRAREDAALQQQFLASPQGQARLARQQGQGWFQITFTVSETDRTAMGVLTGDHQRLRRSSTTHADKLSQIENEGWSLWHIGYVWEQTGTVSRDKFLSSGQVASVTGQVVGIYTFRASDIPVSGTV